MSKCFDLLKLIIYLLKLFIETAVFLNNNYIIFIISIFT